MSGELDRLRAFLDELEVDATTLRRDPRGETWLPEPARSWCEQNPACAAELQQFVSDELELFGLSDIGADPFFTARVVDELPEPLRWTGLSPNRRMLLLAAFHLAAGGIAYSVLAWLTPELLTTAADTAHAWLGSSEASAGTTVSWGAAVAAVVGVGLIAFVSTKSHNPALSSRAE
jgi:hypothetical protein